MNDINSDGQQFLNQQNSHNQNNEQYSKNIVDITQIEISEEQKVNEELFIKQFTEFILSKTPKYLSHEYEFRLIENIKLGSNLFQDIYQFYKDQQQNAELIKNKILLKLKNFRYSMNNVSLIAKFFQSYSSFQNFCNTAQMILNIHNCQTSSYQIFENALLFNILNNHRNIILQNLFINFKHFSLLKRRKILNLAVNHFLINIKNEQNSIPILDNSKEHVIKELSRLSHHLGINFDVDEHDGQHFIYACETILCEYQRLHFSFNLIPSTQIKPTKLIDCINNSFMETFSKDELIVEAFNHIIHSNDRYNIVVFNAINNKEFPSEQIDAWISLRYCRNRQLLFELEKSTKKLQKFKKMIDENLQIEPNPNDNDFCDKYISFIIEQILVFTSAVYIKSGKKADIDPLLEISLDKHLRYANAKNKILSVFAEISRHSNSVKIKEFADKVIEKRPNLIFSQFSFHELFETQIETLEMIGKTLSILLNIQFLTERQITSFYGTFYEPFQFGTFYSNQGEGEFNVSNFEVYPRVEKILDFFSIAPKIVDDICSTMSIKSTENSEYIELAVWTQLLNEINQFPDVSLFGTDFSSIHFNLPVSKDVESLINCRILDDPLFLKTFEERIDPSSSSKSEFTQNLTRFCLLANKLRSLIYKTNLYLPIYLLQFDESHFSTGSKKAIEFIGKSFNFSDYEKIEKLCLKGDFSEIGEIINNQYRYNIVLMIAIQYNNFRSDNHCISVLFNFVQPENTFFITKSEVQDDGQSLFYKEASKRFFVGIDSFVHQDFSNVFFDISEVSDFSDTQKLVNISKKYLNRIELATITNCERILLHDFQQIELFSLNTQFYRPSDGFIDYFSIPSYSQCLLLDCNDNQFSEILDLVSARLKLTSFVRFTSFIKYGRNRAFDLLNRHQIAWESAFLSKLKTCQKMTVSEASNALKFEFLFETGRFQLGILFLIQKVFQTKRACHLKSKGKPLNLSLIPDDEVRDLWKLVNQEAANKEIDSKSSVNMISMERYVPIYLSRFNFTFSDILKTELLNQMDEIDKKIQRNVNLSDDLDYVVNSCDFIKKQIENELLKFAVLRLQTNVSLTNLNICSLVDITRREYKENLPFYTKTVAVPSSQQIYSDDSIGSEKHILQKSCRLAIEFISEVVEQAQRKKDYERSAQLNEQLEMLNKLNLPLKPECYTKKRQASFHGREPYNPSPADAKKQFEHEMKYAHSKIISMIVQAINISNKNSNHSNNNNSSNNINNYDNDYNNNSNENNSIDNNNINNINNYDNNYNNNFNEDNSIDNINNKNRNEDKNIDLSSQKLISMLVPLSSLLFSFVEKSRTQILKTWPSYTAKVKTATFECDEEDILLNDLVKLIKEQYNMMIDYQLSVKNSSHYMTLSQLRDKERTTNHERSAYDDEIEQQIRKEYESKLNEIKKEQQEVLKQFPIVHDKYFREFENVIVKQNQKVFENEEILRPDHEMAKRSLQLSEDSRNEDAETKSEEKNLLKNEEEKKMEVVKLEERLRNDQNIDISLSQKMQPNNNSINSPSRLNSENNDSSAVFAPQEPSIELNNDRFKRRRMVMKSSAETSLFETEKQQEKEENLSDSSKRSMEDPSLLKKENHDVQNGYQSSEKFYEVENDISELKKTIIKLRITKCLHKIAVSNHYTKVINKASQERKEASMLLWFNRKSYEEDTREIKDDIEDCFKRLSTAEKESENLKQELEAQKAVTIKLAHWKELNLRTSDHILKQIGVYQKGPNIEVSKLLKQLDEKREELDALNKEAEDFENQLINKIREPMDEMSKIRRIIQKQQYQNLRMKENLNNENSIFSAKIQNFEEENIKLLIENQKLMSQINQLENKKAQVPSVRIVATQGLFEMNQPSTTRRLKTCYISSRKGKASLTAKSPYAKIGYKSIKKPL